MARQIVQAHSITTTRQHAITARTTRTTHSVIHRALVALRVVIQEVVCRQVVHTVEVKLEDNYEKDISIFMLGTAARLNSYGAGF